MNHQYCIHVDLGTEAKFKEALAEVPGHLLETRYFRSWRSIEYDNLIDHPGTAERHSVVSHDACGIPAGSEWTKQIKRELFVGPLGPPYDVWVCGYDFSTGKLSIKYDVEPMGDFRTKRVRFLLTCSVEGEIPDYIDFDQHMKAWFSKRYGTKRVYSMFY